MCVPALGMQMRAPLVQMSWRKDSWVCRKILSSDLCEPGGNRAQVSTHSWEALAYVRCLLLQTFRVPLSVWHSAGAMQGTGLSETP